MVYRGEPLVPPILGRVLDHFFGNRGEGVRDLFFCGRLVAYVVVVATS